MVSCRGVLIVQLLHVMKIHDGKGGGSRNLAGKETYNGSPVPHF